MRTTRWAVAAAAATIAGAGLVAGPALGDHPTPATCADFATEEEAAAYLVAHPDDPDGLDTDDDGIACEADQPEPTTPTSTETTPTSTETTPTPTETTPTSTETTPTSTETTPTPTETTPTPTPPPPPGVAYARAIDDSCPSGAIPEDGFLDVSATSSFESAIDCVAHWGITNGTSATTYSPLAAVTRGQMAAFIARLVVGSGGALPAAPPDAFTDDETSPFEADINGLAAAGIVNGTGPGTFAPRSYVTRAQMAAFLVRAYHYRSPTTLDVRADYFPDDAGLGLEADINRAAGAGFTRGYADGTYRPHLPIRRDEMAAFLSRVLDLLVEEGHAVVPGAIAP